ncbi:MAG: ECF-type riboflavin transporter substrate-binding protein [Oscillospiraceae bacterium]|nr:ECF-type riboflavin transporter substrate-binding protein [Oscillospiraceae bacterium]
MNATVKRIGTIAAGSVLFFLLGRYVTIPSPIPTVNICVQYGPLAFLAVACGPLIGSMTGLIGHILIDLSGGQMFWSWIIATTAFGGLLGVLANVTRLDPAHRDREMLVHFNLCQVATHVVCWAGIAPVLDILFYNENMDTIFAEGLTAALSNAVTTAIVGSSMLAIYAVFTARRAKKD